VAQGQLLGIAAFTAPGAAGNQDQPSLRR
jgi:hypothetical protein